MATQILVKPVINEKSERLKKQNKFCFKVALTANKIEIKKAVEQKYSVNVVDVHTLVVAARQKSVFRSGRAIIGRTSKYKKAIITLALGDTINFYKLPEEVPAETDKLEDED